MPRLRDFLLRPISSTFGYILGWIVHPKSSPFMSDLLKRSMEIPLNESNWHKETCNVGDFDLSGASYTPDNYQENDGVIICFFGNGDVYQNNQPFMKWLGDTHKRKVISFNNRGVNIDTNTRGPICETEIISDAVCIAKKFLNENNCEKSLIYGHSLGGAQAVKAGARLLEEGVEVKVYSWNSLRSISAVARELLGANLSRAINVTLGTAFSFALRVALGFAIPTLSFGLLAATGAGFVGSFLMGSLLSAKTNKSFTYNFLLKPLLWLGGWDLNCEKEGEALLRADKLSYGNIKQDGVIRKGAMFADAMDPILKSINQNPPTMVFNDPYQSEYFSAEPHMYSPRHITEASENIAQFLNSQSPRSFR